MVTVCRIDEQESESDQEEDAAGFVNAEDLEYKKKEKLTSEQKREKAREKLRPKFGHQERDKLHTNAVCYCMGIWFANHSI